MSHPVSTLHNAARRPCWTRLCTSADLYMYCRWQRCRCLAVLRQLHAVPCTVRLPQLCWLLPHVAVLLLPGRPGKASPCPAGTQSERRIADFRACAISTTASALLEGSALPMPAQRKRRGGGKREMGI